ncbi:MAG: OsmC family protein, partial [Pseudomonadota bacterium]
IAAKHGFVVDEYDDRATGIMEKDAEGKMAMTEVILRPLVVFSEDRAPSAAQLEEMHHQSHGLCFIANSVKTNVRTEIQ